MIVELACGKQAGDAGAFRNHPVDDFSDRASFAHWPSTTAGGTTLK
ncbi:hypothetical protein [uncultured Altibacter sp.]